MRWVHIVQAMNREGYSFAPEAVFTSEVAAIAYAEKRYQEVKYSPVEYDGMMDCYVVTGMGLNNDPEAMDSVRFVYDYSED